MRALGRGHEFLMVVRSRGREEDIGKRKGGREMKEKYLIKIVAIRIFGGVVCDALGWGRLR